MDVVKGGNVKHGSMYRPVVGLLAPVGLAVRALAAQVGVVPVNPAWLKADGASRTVEFSLIAAMTPVNGEMNFNGSTAGAIRLTVPLGWNVVLHFRNAGAMLPHSAEVIRAVAALPPGAMPPAFVHAASGQLAQGMPSGGHQDIRFVADKAGAYFIYCPVQGHGKLGMWMRLDVSTSAALPTVTTAKQGPP